MRPDALAYILGEEISAITSPMRGKKRDRNNKNIHTYVEAAAKIYWGRESTRVREGGGHQSAGKKMEISEALLI